MIVRTWILLAAFALFPTSAHLFKLPGREIAEAPQTSSLRLARIFSDGVVLQRDAAIPVWGWANPGSRITVAIGKETKQVAAGSDSSWQVVFAPRAAGNPTTLTVSSDGTKRVVQNIVFGDVWIASGQSNMEWKLADSDGGAAEIASAKDSLIRQFKIPNSWSWNPEKDLSGGTWASASPTAAGEFSGVAYFFAKTLRKEVGVPIGIVNSAWSGAAIEPYISRSAQGLSDSAWKKIVDTETAYNKTVRDGLIAKLGDLPTSDAGMNGNAAPWAAADLDESAWKPISVPSPWERNGYAGLDGVVWLRTSFELTADEAKRATSLTLGKVDDDDITWINGVEVGRTSGYFKQREYSLPAGSLRAGRNVIAVRVTDGTGDGGIIGVGQEPFVDLGGTKKSLAGSWKLRIGVASFREDGQHVNKIPTGTYNRMMHPIVRFPIKGVIWYQGESNSNNDAQARAYRGQFATLITSWRKEFNGGRTQFPFLWVQLPGYGTVEQNPPLTGGWALIRDAQSAALALPNTGQAVTLDVGEATNLHPTNKRDVGNRLALAARKIAYKQTVEFSGPVYQSHTVAGNRVSVSFAHAAGLTLRATNDTISGFSVAGADKRFVWANARLVGNRVEVWSDAVSSPVSVRYAWSNSPHPPRLFNGAGLPASPFRTDSW